ncbi:MAG: (2Fe-2S) ferredoxin domain-containing protein [Spirochaetales bacterium]|nr:MAG: (2Fe-2S) ferredoxin domain-containing protein [Spirochaetales bacterium]
MMTPMDLVKKKRAQAIARIVGKGYLSTKRVYVGMATCEIAAGSKEVWDVFDNAIKNGGLANIYLSQKGCAGRCNLEPMVEIVEAGKIPVKYCKVTPEKAEQIIRKHLKKGAIIEEWTIR